MSAVRTEDVASPESIILAVYEVLSGRAGDERDWDRWRTLYAPDARLMPIERDAAGVVKPSMFDPDGYIESRRRLLAENDFFEWETAREEKHSGSMAHVWSSYDAARTPHGKPIRRGVNSVQLWNDGSRWWILSVIWDAKNAAVIENSD